MPRIQPKELRESGCTRLNCLRTHRHKAATSALLTTSLRRALAAQTSIPTLWRLVKHPGGATSGMPLLVNPEHEQRWNLRQS